RFGAADIGENHNRRAGHVASELFARRRCALRGAGACRAGKRAIRFGAQQPGPGVAGPSSPPESAAAEPSGPGAADAAESGANAKNRDRDEILARWRRRRRGRQDAQWPSGLRERRRPDHARHHRPTSFRHGRLNWKPDSKGTTPQSLNSGVNARRAHLGVTGKFMGDWDYNLIFDFGGSTDSGANVVLENAYITYNGLNPYHFDLGYQDVPYTLDEATSSNNIMFIE